MSTLNREATFFCEVGMQPEEYTAQNPREQQPEMNNYEVFFTV
jgi:hypothetical protein